MKNSILSLLLVTTFITSAFATGENKISSVVLQSFKIDFGNAKNVSWSSRTGYAKAEFILNDRKREVFYNSSGYIVAQSTNIELDELPIGAKRSFSRKYDSYIVKEAIKFESENESSCYYISAENEKEKVILKVDENERLTIFKKIKKS